MRELVYAEFDGEIRPFALRIGEIRALEKECNAGIGAIAKRVAAWDFTLADIRETIRLGLEGGGMDRVEATARVLRYFDPGHLDPFVLIAANVLAGVFRPIAEAAPGKAKRRRKESPATSPPSTRPES